MAKRNAAADRSFGRVLRTKAVDRIVPETLERLEAGRRLYAQQVVAAAEAELKLLAEERDRVEREEPNELRLARLDRLIGVVEAELADGRFVLTEIERAVVPTADGWTVLGRILSRDGAPPKGAEVVFLDERGEPIKDIAVLKSDADGTVRQVIPGELVKRLAAQNTQVAAAARINGRVVVIDENRVPVRAGGLYQFDLRTGPEIKR